MPFLSVGVCIPDGNIPDLSFFDFRNRIASGKSGTRIHHHRSADIIGPDTLMDMPRKADQRFVPFDEAPQGFTSYMRARGYLVIDRMPGWLV